MSYFRAGIHDFFFSNLQGEACECVPQGFKLRSTGLYIVRRLKDHVFIYGPVTGLESWCCKGGLQNFVMCSYEAYISKPGPRYVPLYSGPYLHTFIARVTPCVEHCRSYGEVCTQTQGVWNGIQTSCVSYAIVWVVRHMLHSAGCYVSNIIYYSR